MQATRIPGSFAPRMRSNMATDVMQFAVEVAENTVASPAGIRN
jgi:hypothetical protein